MSTLLDADSINVTVQNFDSPFGGVIVDLPDTPVVVELSSTPVPVKSVFGRIGDIVALETDYAAFYAPLGGELPVGGTIGQVLTKNSSTAHDASWQDAPGGTFANPTATVGLTAVNGSGTNAMRSNAAPALDVSIAPTWSGIHTFSLSPIVPTPTTNFQAATKKYVDDNSVGGVVGNLTDAGTDGITVTGGTGAVIGAGTSLSQHVADASHNGYLSSTDWSTFNSKLSTNQTITLSGDTTGSGTTAITTTTSLLTGVANLQTTLAATNTISSVFTSTLNSSGTAATGFGQKWNFSLEDATQNSIVAGNYSFSWTDATHATRTSKFALQLINSGTAGDVLTISGAGNGVFTGTVLGSNLSGTNTGDQTTVTGSAGSLKSTATTGVMEITGPGAATTRIKTIRDADDTILELGGSYTPTGTWTSLTMVTPVLGTPTSGTLTNCTGLPISGLVASTSTALGVGSIELGAASDTTIARSGAGAITVEGVQVILSGAALGTPASGTLTNCTGLPIAGLTASTSTAIGVGTIELGAASDTTIARSGAGAITVEGVQVILSGAALGTPASGTLTNCTGLPIAGLTASTSTAIGVGTIELGHATDTTIARSGAGAITVEGVQVILSGAALGTPASGTLTNCTGLPIAGLVASTSTAIGVGTIELGAASDTTIARSGAGAITVEGVQVILSGAALGTPSSGTLTNCTFPTLNQNTTGSAASLSISGQTGLMTVTGLVSTNRIKTVRDAADTILELGGSYTPTGTWTSLTMVTPVLGTPTSGTLTNCTIPDSAARTHDLTAIPNDTGGWNEYFVTTSDATNLNTTFADITGLVTGTLTNSAWYEFEAVIRLLNAADTAGIKLAIHGAGTGTAAAVFSTGTTNTTAAAAATSFAINAIDTGTVAFVTYSSGEGVAFIKGFFRATSTGTATMSIQMAKVTSNTATCRVGSVLRIRKAHT